MECSQQRTQAIVSSPPPAPHHPHPSLKLGRALLLKSPRQRTTPYNHAVCHQLPDVSGCYAHANRLVSIDKSINQSTLLTTCVGALGSCSCFGLNWCCSYMDHVETEYKNCRNSPCVLLPLDFSGLFISLWSYLAGGLHMYMEWQYVRTERFRIVKWGSDRIGKSIAAGKNRGTRT